MLRHTAIQLHNEKRLAVLADNAGIILDSNLLVEFSPLSDTLTLYSTFGRWIIPIPEISYAKQIGTAYTVFNGDTTRRLYWLRG